MKKKGALALSVNAIVVLILAVVMLGLALGFVRGMFGKVTTSFEEQIAAEPNPSTPTGSEPITLSRESLIVRSGDGVVLKTGIYNPTSEVWSNANVEVTCKTDDVIDEGSQFNSKQLEPGKSFVGTYLFTIGSVSEGTQLCKVTVKEDDSTNTNYTKDFTIRVLR
ncbi:MAG: hypothetical protein U9O94_05290 [Nanoarchaeota archaeon]|nr:hypothetical protein [Nanoarchaeota archaeon]